MYFLPRSEQYNEGIILQKPDAHPRAVNISKMTLFKTPMGHIMSYDLILYNSKKKSNYTE
jgi:hypothetical protein